MVTEVKVLCDKLSCPEGETRQQSSDKTLLDGGRDGNSSQMMCNTDLTVITATQGSHMILKSNFVTHRCVQLYWILSLSALLPVDVHLFACLLAKYLQNH